MTRTPALIAAGFMAASLSACGLTGDLQRPDPLFGRPAGEVDPATLPEERDRDLPQLPARQPATSDQGAEDELLGGPGGAL
ncbi:LPS translocon maturation chaperone LptM [Hyphomonas sp.]|uniref:LPS translocon maturation chaperone LptM n=1 Tax=Hyphomonas sp. TaxID=87 RepID=UPI00391AD95F